MSLRPTSSKASIPLWWHRRAAGRKAGVGIMPFGFVNEAKMKREMQASNSERIEFQVTLPNGARYTKCKSPDYKEAEGSTFFTGDNGGITDLPLTD